MTQSVCTDHAAEPAAPLPLHDPTDMGVHRDTWVMRVWGCREEGQGEQGRLGRECWGFAVSGHGAGGEGQDWSDACRC